MEVKTGIEDITEEVKTGIEESRKQLTDKYEKFANTLAGITDEALRDDLYKQWMEMKVVEHRLEGLHEEELFGEVLSHSHTPDYVNLHLTDLVLDRSKKRLEEFHEMVNDASRVVTPSAP